MDLGHNFVENILISEHESMVLYHKLLCLPRAPSMMLQWSYQCHPAHHSVLIYISCVDYIVTLYRLRHPSRHPPDYTTYLTHKGW